MRAAQNGHADIIRLLLEAGASIEAKDKVSKRIIKQITTDWESEKNKQKRELELQTKWRH